jgi:KUP system potassium uptake protein
MKESSNSVKYQGILALSALGVVYGDIGTSPLYALKESFHHTHNIAVAPENIFGILSLIFWSLIIVVSIKYLIFIVRADNQGEGGVLALTALLGTISLKSPRTLRVLTLLGIFGTALLYGDGIITPAISVLSAVEGLEFAAPKLHDYIIPITITILIGLFSIQKHGTTKVGKVFGPITLLWFFILAVLGISKVIERPDILMAVNPMYAVKFFIINSWRGFTVLGSVFLVVTGGEALYSDLGHFGKRPIRLAWFVVVLPALIINYFGQGALLLQNPKAIESPFFLMAPNWALIPLVIIATLSTCIASQALITGVFSLTMQAVQLQYIPRVTIDHTSSEEFGQIYVRIVNTLLMVSCIALVVTFKSSSNLAAAYGIAVTTTMVITTILFYFVAVYSWKWHWAPASLLCGFFLIIEGSFWGANLLKVIHGGWFPLVVGAIIFTVMTTWHKGRQILSARMLEIILPLNDFLNTIRTNPPQRVPGVAVYMSGHPQYTPPTLAQSFKHFKCIHEHMIFLFVQTVDLPHVPESNRVRFQNIGTHIYKVVIQYGFMDLPNIPHAMKGLQLDGGLSFDADHATFFLGREHIIATNREGMALWREKLFAMMSRNAQPATHFFQIPRSRVFEIGSMIDL